jgi:hypothetical protein
MPRTPQIPIQFLVLIENYSIINSFHTAVAPSNLKPSQSARIHQELSEDTKSRA